MAKARGTLGLPGRVAHLGLRPDCISQDRRKSDRGVVKLGGQLSETHHRAACLGRTARCGLPLQPFRYRVTAPRCEALTPGELDRKVIAFYLSHPDQRDVS